MTTASQVLANAFQTITESRPTPLPALDYFAPLSELDRAKRDLRTISEGLARRRALGHEVGEHVQRLYDAMDRVWAAQQA